MYFSYFTLFSISVCSDLWMNIHYVIMNYRLHVILSTLHSQNILICCPSAFLFHRFFHLWNPNLSEFDRFVSPGIQTVCLPLDRNVKIKCQSQSNQWLSHKHNQNCKSHRIKLESLHLDTLLDLFLVSIFQFLIFYNLSVFLMLFYVWCKNYLDHE